MSIAVAILTEKLKAKQVREGLSDVAFSKKLGISRQTWAFVKGGTRKPGMKFLSAVIKTYPDLQLDVYKVMNEDNHSGEVKDEQL